MKLSKYARERLSVVVAEKNINLLTIVICSIMSPNTNRGWTFAA